VFSSIFGFLASFPKPSDRFIWNLKLVRSVYGILVFFASFDALFSSSVLFENPVYGVTPASSIIMHVSAGFFVFEVLAMFTTYVYAKQWDNSLAVHHILGLCGGFAICVPPPPPPPHLTPPVLQSQPLSRDGHFD
jgi:hypothetical protein